MKSLVSVPSRKPFQQRAQRPAARGSRHRVDEPEVAQADERTTGPKRAGRRREPAAVVEQHVNFLADFALEHFERVGLDAR